MLWSLIKIVVFVALVAAATLGASYLLDMQGGVLIAMGGIEINLTPLKAVIAAVVLVLAVWLFLKLFGLLIALLHFINGDETALSRYFDRNRERKGFDALSEGMMALASGEGRKAMSKAAKAERYLDRPELTTLLTAQAAEQVGDRAKAEEAYKKLVTTDRTRFVGVRGLMHQKLLDGDTDTALALAEKAFGLKPGHEEVQDTLLRLQAQKSDWKGARSTLKAKLRHGTLPRDVHRRRDAVLALSEAKGAYLEDAGSESGDAAIEANKMSPDLIPAAVMASETYVARNQKRQATKVLKKAWETSPHPDLAAAYAQIEPDESPKERLKRFSALVKPVPTHRESRLLMAELNIAAEDFPEARRAIGNLTQESPDARTLTIMAAIERGEGAPDAIVKGWLARAVTAPRGPQWTCENCHNIQANWTPICNNCAAFDTLEWTTAPVEEYQSQVGTSMLPLIVGEIEDNSRTPATVDSPPVEPEEAEILPTDGLDTAPKAESERAEK
tara:strand:+ start:10208 stop:11710 length:1503 start_codon:yes stop_codon:yes gene_type:complete